MANDWLRSTWGDEVTLEYGKAIRGYSQTQGNYPVFGSNGPIGWTSDALTQGPGVVLGRKGAYRGVEFCREPFWVIDTAYYLVPKTDMDMRWLYYAAKHYKLGEVDDGSPIPSTTRAAVYMLELDVPPKHEQQAISRVLGTLDDKIELIRQENETLEAIAQAIFKSWFIDFDPVRAKMEGRAPAGMDEETAALFPDELVESELGLVPKGWDVKGVGDVVDTVGGATPDTKNPDYWEPAEHHWTSPKDLSGINDPVMLSTERRISTTGLSKISSGLLPSGTLLMSSRAPIGYLAITDVAVAINQGYIAMPPGGQVSPLYMLRWCQANMEGIKGRANGSTFMEISKKAFRPIPILLPNSKLLDLFEETCGTLFDKLVLNSKQAQTLSEIRDSLLPRLISGKLRIAEDELESQT